MLAHESRLAQQSEASNVVASLNLTHTKAESKASNDSTVKQEEPSPAPQAQFTASRCNFRGGRGGKFNRGGRFGCGGRENIQCQVCSKFGHDASICYHRYAPPTMAPAYGIPYQYVHPGYVPQAQNSTANATMWPPQPINPVVYPLPPQAYVVQAAPTIATSNQLCDTDASHHMTGIALNPTNATALSGQDHVFLGNGQGLPIHSISSKSIPSPKKV